MSDNESTQEKTEQKVTFTEKEEMVLKLAWRCLKSGPPEIDIEKLARLAGFNTHKTATNTWGVIKKKLFAGMEGGAPMPATPKANRTKGTKVSQTSSAKKRGKKATLNNGDSDSDEGGPLTKVQAKKRKTEEAENEIKAEEGSDGE